MSFVVEAMRISKAFLINLPPGADDTLANMASVSGMDIASLKSLHASLHAKSSRHTIEPLPPLTSPEPHESHEPQTPSTAVASPPPLTPLQSKSMHVDSAFFSVKQEDTKESIIHLTPAYELSLPSMHILPPNPIQTAIRVSDLGDLEYPSSEVDAEELEAESRRTAVPKSLSEFLSRFQPHESTFDQLLNLIDCQDHKNHVRG